MFDNQFEITIQEKRENRFSFIITKNHSLTYTGKHNFHTHEACVSAIERLKTFASHPNSYEIDPAGGTFTVKIVEKSDSTSLIRFTHDTLVVSATLSANFGTAMESSTGNSDVHKGDVKANGKSNLVVND